MRNVLLLCWRDTHHPQGGGSEIYLEQVGKHLSNKGYNVFYQTAYYPGAKRKELRNGIRFFRYGKKYSVYVFAFMAMLLSKIKLGYLRKYKPDIVIDTQNGIPFFSSLLFKKSIILVHHTHTVQWKVAKKYEEIFGNFIESKLSPLLYKNKQYVTVSSSSKIDLVNLGVKENNIKIIPPGIHPVENKVNNKNKYPTLCTLGRLVPHKQIEDAIWVIYKLSTLYPQAHLYIIGSGWWQSNLEQYVQVLGIEKHVTFLGYISEELKNKYLNRSWIHLMPSWKEGWGISIIEAAQQNTPSIGYIQSGGLKDSIIDNKTGYLVENRESLLKKTLYLIENQDIRDNFSISARRYSEKFSWAEAGEKFFDLIEGLYG